ncbi:MAG: TrmH family RNA methyltransferase [Rhodospirillaceae bacterium]
MNPVLRLALYQPDIPPNTAAVLRTCACLGIAAEVIEPCGFVFGGSPMRRAGMDYLDRVQLTRHDDWSAFQAAYPGQRRVLLTTRATQPFTAFAFAPGDILIVGRETAGVPDDVHAAVDARVTVPLAPGMRSLNMAVAAAIVAAEALRQLDAFPQMETPTDA